MRNNCVHQFIIPPPNGTSSVGVCELCGFKRKMFNYQEEQKSYSPWQQTKKNTGQIKLYK